MLFNPSQTCHAISKLAVGEGLAAFPQHLCDDFDVCLSRSVAPFAKPISPLVGLYELFRLCPERVVESGGVKSPAMSKHFCLGCYFTPMQWPAFRSEDCLS